MQYRHAIARYGIFFRPVCRLRLVEMETIVGMLGRVVSGYAALTRPTGFNNKVRSSMNSWWDLGEWSGYSGSKLDVHAITCAFCFERGNFVVEHQASKAKPNDSKVLYFATLRCGNCSGYVMALWSPSSDGQAHDYRQLPFPLKVTKAPDVWPSSVGRLWLQAQQSLHAEIWDAAAIMARSALQAALRDHHASGNNLKQEIDCLAQKGLIPPVMQEWAHELRELGNESAHPKPDYAGVAPRDAKDMVEFATYMFDYLYSLPTRISEYKARRSGGKV